MSRSNVTIRFVGTLKINGNIDPILPTEQILKQAKELLANGEFAPDYLTLEIANIQDLDPPTAIYPDGSKEWTQNGQYHRIDGPAIVYPNGKECWMQNGKKHRTDGPALIYPNGDKYYYLNGKQLTEQEWKEQVEPPTEIDIYGTKLWKNQNGQPHRDNGPAAIWKDGSKFWYQNGKLHRDNGPALVLVDGTQEWFQNGKRHREDGPASILPSGSNYFFLYDQLIPKSEWEKLVRKFKKV